MSTSNEKCLDPWHGFLIILGVCIVILVGIFNEFQGGTHHARIHAQPKGAITQAAFANTNPDIGPVAGQIAF